MKRIDFKERRRENKKKKEHEHRFFESSRTQGVGPEEGHENDPRAGTPLLWRGAERVGVVQLGEEKAPGRPFNT